MYSEARINHKGRGKLKKIFDFIVGICVWGAIAYGGYYFFIKGDDTPREMTEADFNIQLQEFKSWDRSDRHTLVTAIATAHGHPTEDTQHFINCMGDFAENKLETLIFKDVFAWCETEQTNNRERFVSHYNELDSLDEVSHAVSACEKFIEAELVAPTTAEHPSGGQGYIDHGKGRYTIDSYVDAQNSFGAQIRTKYICVVQYNGIEVPWHYTSWNLSRISIKP